jgi:NAD(P)-dependent dehydrogenase (short-subunit alcohol dehydrogenase family)
LTPKAQAKKLIGAPGRTRFPSTCAELCFAAALIPLLRLSTHGKIVLLSGGGATTKLMPFFSAYAASKTAVVRFGETLAENLREAGIDVNCVVPGALNTQMLEEVLAAGPEKVGPVLLSGLGAPEGIGWRVDRSCRCLCVYFTTSDSNGITGKFISGVWDPWTNFEVHRKDLQDTDVYTLRRIVPHERGLHSG